MSLQTKINTNRALSLLAFATMLSGCGAPSTSAPDRESPVLETISFEATVWGVDSQTGVFYDGQRHTLRQFDGRGIVDLSTRFETDLLGVRSFDDGTVWLGSLYGGYSSAGHLVRYHEATGFETIDDCVPAVSGASDSYYDARASDDVWVASSFSLPYQDPSTILCHYDGTRATSETLPFRVYDLIAAAEGIYLVVPTENGDLLFRANGRSTFEPLRLADAFASDLFRLGAGVLAVGSDDMGARSLHHITSENVARIAEVPPQVTSVVVGTSLDRVWAIEHIIGYEDARCFDLLDFETVDCTRVGWSEDVVYHLEGGAFVEVGYTGCSGECIASPIPLPDGRLLIVHDQYGEAAVVE